MPTADSEPESNLIANKARFDKPWASQAQPMCHCGKSEIEVVHVGQRLWTSGPLR